MTGTLYGLGVGPGDPELITVKALNILKRVAVIAYPALEAGDSLARAIVADYLPAEAMELAIRVPMSRDPDAATGAYDAGAERIAGHLSAGRDVALLCEGDPLFYGSFMYVNERLAGRFPVVTVPGVTSVAAGAARLGIPLTSRDDVFSVIPATLDEVLLEARLKACETAAILKVGRHFAKVKSLLEKLGLAAQAHYIERATMAAEKVLPLDQVEPEAVPYFSLILVGRSGSLGR